MTRREFYKKLKPVAAKWLKAYESDGKLAVRDSFVISMVKELLFRLDYEADDQVDDLPFLDRIRPLQFIGLFLEICDDWEDAANMLCCGDTGYYAYYEIMHGIEVNFAELEKKGKKDKSNGKK